MCSLNSLYAVVPLAVPTFSGLAPTHEVKSAPGRVEVTVRVRPTKDEDEQDVVEVDTDKAEVFFF